MWFDSAAQAEETEIKVLLGPPRHYLVDAVIQQGIAPDTTASATLAADFLDYDRIMLLDSTVAFLPGRGAVFIDGPAGGDWFTYEAIDSTENALMFVKHLSGIRQSIAAGADVSQWRDITSSVSKHVKRGTLRGAAGTWQSTLEGANWNSLIQFDLATLLVLKRYRNSTYVDLQAPIDGGTGGWTDWLIAARMTLGPVKVQTDIAFDADWSVTAHGMSHILRQMANTPGYYGSEEIVGIRSASSEIKDPSQIPWLGDGITPLTADKAGDRNRNTGWASAGTPTLGDPLPARPTGNVQGSPPLPDFVRGYGIKVQQVGGNLGQQDIWFEIANISQEEVPPNYGAGATPPDPATWGNIDIGGYRFYNAAGYWFTPGIVNGLRLDRIDIGPGKTMILCFDRETYLRRHSPPAGVEVREFRQCDGWYPGVPPNQAVRGGAARWTLNRKADAVGIRSGDARWQDYVAYGNWNPPAEFWVTNGDNPIRDQNASPMPADRVWGNRSSNNAMYLYGPGATVSPVSGIPAGGSIRRIEAIGGGVWESNPEDDYGPGGGNFFNHDSGTAADWEVRTTPKLGNEGPLEAFESYDIELPDHPVATVLEDNSDVGDADGTLRVGDGQAWEYDLLSDGEYIVVQGGAVWLTYTHFDYDTFYGVKKIKGAGIDITGLELSNIWYNSNPEIHGSAPVYELGRPMRVSAIEINTWYNPPSATVVEDRRYIDATIRVKPGDTARFPDSGTLGFTTLNPREIRGSLVLTYTSRDESTFYGVANPPGNAAPRPVRAGATIVDARPAPRLRKYSVLLSRRNHENIQDPDTFLGSNQDWQLAVATGNTGTNDRGYTGTVALDGPSQRLKRIHVRVEAMWGEGPAYLTEVKVHRKPRRIIDDPTRAAQLANAAYTGVSVIEDILIAAGIPAWQRDIPQMGLPIRGERISQGNVWDTLVQLCRKYGYIIIDGPDDIIRVRADPRILARAVPTGAPSIELNPSTIANFQVTPLAKLDVSQVEGTGYNHETDETWTLRYPSTPSTFGGDIRQIGSFPAESMQTTLNRLRLEYLSLNGGFEFSCDIGHQEDLQLATIAPLNSVVDQAGRDYSGYQVILTEIEHTMDADGQEGSLAGRDFRSA